MKEFKSFSKGLLSAGLLLLIACSPILYYNLIIDPYKVFFSKKTSTYFEPNKQYMKMRHVLRNKNKYDSFIFGSSRVNFIDPEKIKSAHYYNMTYSAGIPWQHYKNIKHLYKKGVKIKNLIIGIDHISLFSPIGEPEWDTPVTKDYPVSFIEKIRFYKSYLLTRPLWKDVKYSNTPGPFDQSKILVTGIIFPPEKTIDSTIYVNRNIFLKPFRNISSEYAVEEALASIDSIVTFSKEHNINLKVFINPVHHITYLYQDIDMYFEALKGLSNITDFWDFSDINEVTTNNLYYNETSHYNFNAGDLVIDIIEEQNELKHPKNFGKYITKNTVDQRIRTHKKNLNGYFHCIFYYNTNNDFNDLTVDRKSIAQIQIESLNGFPLEKDTFNVFTPVVFAEGSININPTSKILSELYLIIGNKSFQAQIVKTSNNFENDQTKWKMMIPTSQLNNDFTGISFIAVYKDNTISRINPQFVFKKNYFLADLPGINLSESKETKELGIYTINGSRYTPNIPIINKNYIKMDGTFKGTKKEFQPDKIRISISDKKYYSFYYSIRDYKRNPKYPGWGITFPTSGLKNGAHKIQLDIISSAKKTIYNSEDDLSFFYYNEKNSFLLDQYQEINGNNHYIIDRINSYLSINDSTLYTINSNRINISGWAIDTQGRKTLKEVYVKMNGQLFLANYGIKREGVMRRFKSESFLYSGWTISIPVEVLKKGKQKLSVIMIPYQPAKYYESKEEINLNIN